MNDDINKVGELSITENKLIILVETFIIKKNVMRNPTRKRILWNDFIVFCQSKRVKKLLEDILLPL